MRIKLSGRRVARILKSRAVRRVLLGVAGAFVLVNVGLLLGYRERSYPGERVQGRTLGSVPFSGMGNKLESLKLLPEDLKIQIKDKTLTKKTAELGIQLDIQRIENAIEKQRSWLPLWNILAPRVTPMYVAVHDATLQKQLEALAAESKQAAVDAQIRVEQGNFVLTPDQAGFVVDMAGSKTTVTAALEKGKTSAVLPLTILEANQKQASLQPALLSLQAQQKTSITYHYQAKKKVFTSAEISGWYQREGASYTLSDLQLRAGIITAGSGFGISLANLDEVQAATKQALQAQKNLEITLKANPVRKRYSYCTAIRDIDAAHLPGLDGKLAAIYADGRGWGVSGQVAYTKVASGCDFTVWLSAAASMPTFGGVCDADWSCRIGPNVVINFDRWTSASTSWNASGGSLEDYRVMVINHETGHWLGFYHQNCPGPGQPAPVMQQQSIDLQGCTFNPWPTAGEINSFKKTIGI